MASQARAVSGAVPGNLPLTDARPNILVVGVGHSGTTIVTRLLATLGWQLGDADERFAEHGPLRAANRYALQHDQLPAAAIEALDMLDTHPPWAAKDPRFSVTLHLWAPLFQSRSGLPLVLHLTRDPAAVAASYLKRNELVRGRPGNTWNGSSRGMTVDEQYASLASQLARWPGPIVTLAYEQLAAAHKLFAPR